MSPFIGYIDSIDRKEKDYEPHAFRKQQKEDKNEKYHRIENFYGSFERSFSLPENVNADAIRCESKDGILTVHIPKTEPTKHQPKQISVQ